MFSVHIGQCGNQMGIEFWSQLLSVPNITYMTPGMANAYPGFDAWVALRNEFLHDDGTARMIAVDSEPKVISHVYHMLHTLSRSLHAFEVPPRPTKGILTLPDIHNNFVLPSWSTPSAPSQPQHIPLSAPARPTLLDKSLHYNPATEDSSHKSVCPRFSREARLEPAVKRTFDDHLSASSRRAGTSFASASSTREGAGPGHMGSRAGQPRLGRRGSARGGSHGDAYGDGSSSSSSAGAGVGIERRGTGRSSGSGPGSSSASHRPRRSGEGKGVGMGGGAERTVIYEQSGRGNNWALGYYGAQTPRSQRFIREDSARSAARKMAMPGHERVIFGEDRYYHFKNSDNNSGMGVGMGRRMNTDVSQQGSGAGALALRAEGDRNSLSSLTLDSLRRHMERTDATRGCLLWHSLGGGTGSGLGTRITEDVRDMLGNKRLIMSVLGAPARAGEVVLQHYNTALTVSGVYEHADCVYVCSNDDVLQALTAARGGAVSAHAKAATPMGSAAVATYNRLLALEQQQQQRQRRGDAVSDLSTGLTWVTSPPTLLQRDVSLNKHALEATAAFAHVNAYVASSVIDFLAPQTRKTAETAMHDRQSLNAGSRKREPASASSSESRRQAREVMESWRAELGYDSAINTSSTLGTIEASKGASPAMGLPYITPAWQSVSRQLSSTLTQLCPTPDAKLIELWSSSALLGSKPAADWNSHVDVLSRCVPRVLPGLTAGDAAAALGQRDRAAAAVAEMREHARAQGTLLWNAAVRDVQGAGRGDGDGDVDDAAMARALGRTMSAQVLLHGAEPYSPSQHARGPCMAAGASFEGMYGGKSRSKAGLVDSTVRRGAMGLVESRLAALCPLPAWRQDPQQQPRAKVTLPTQAPSLAGYQGHHAAAYAGAVAQGGLTASSRVAQQGGEVLPVAISCIRQAVAEQAPRDVGEHPGHGITMAVNRGRHAWTLRQAVERARLLLGQGAYVHWFERYGCAKEHIVEATESCDEIVQTYYDLLR